jgi:hypothetical protein
MEVMPVPFGIGEGEFLDKRAFGFEVCDHLLHGDMVIGDGGGFSIAGEAIVSELDDEGRLVGFCPAGNGKGVAECQVIRIIVTGHRGQN